MGSYKKAEKKNFQALPNVGVSMTLLCVNTAH